MFFPNWLYIYKGHLKSSLKTVLISSIGLIFALAILTSTLVYINSIGPSIYVYSSQNALNSTYPSISSEHAALFPNYQSSGKDFGITLSYSNSSDTLNSIQSTLHQTLQQRVNALNLAPKISSIQFLTMTSPSILISLNTTSRTVYGGTINEYVNRSVQIVEISSMLRPELARLNSKIGIGTLPAQNGNTIEGYLVYHSDYNITGITYYPELTNTTKIYTYYFYSPPGSEMPKANNIRYSLNISGYTDYQQLNYTAYPHLVDIFSQNPYMLTLFVNNLTTFWQMLNTPLRTIPYFLHTDIFVNIIGTISINYQALNAYNANTDLETFQRLEAQLQDDLTTLTNTLQLSLAYHTVGFYSERVFLAAATIASNVLIELLLYAFPIILVALFVANYSFGLIHRNVLRHIGTYKTRGASNTLILFMQLVDLVFILAIAIGGGIILGLPISSLVLHTDNFLSFNGATNAVLIVDLIGLLQVLVLTGLVLEFLVQITRIIRLAKVTIVQTENPVEQTDPFWKRHYIDVFLFFTGGMGFIVSYTAITQQWPFQNVFLVLGIPTPLLLALGTVLVFSRIFPSILNKISTYLWKNFGGLFAFSMKNVTRHKQASTRAVMLLGILIVFLFTFLTIPISYNNWTQKTLAYNLGAEGVATLPGTTNTYFYNATLVKILETNYSQYFQGITPFLKIVVQSSTTTTPNTVFGYFLAINTSTFLSAADIPISLNTKNAVQKDMQILENNNSVLNILVQEKFLAFHDTGIGKTLTYIDTNQKSYQFKILDTFSRWPNLFDQYINYNGQNLYGVTSIAPFISNTNVFQNSLYTLASAGLYFNFKDGINQTYVAQILEEKFSLSMTLLDQQVYDATHQIPNIAMMGQINADIIVSLLIGGTILLMFAWLQLIERRKEVFTERTLGMKMYQMSMLFLTESLILLVAGIIIGILMGGGLNTMITLFITYGPAIVPYIPYFPLDLIGLSVIILALLAIIGAIIPAIIVTKQDISHSFAGEK